LFPAIIRIKAPENTPVKKPNTMHNEAVIFAILAAISNVAMHVALPLQREAHVDGERVSFLKSGTGFWSAGHQGVSGTLGARWPVL
jgi:hypothetical protein